MHSEAHLQPLQAAIGDLRQARRAAGCHDHVALAGAVARRLALAEGLPVPADIVFKESDPVACLPVRPKVVAKVVSLALVRACLVLDREAVGVAVAGCLALLEREAASRPKEPIAFCGRRARQIDPADDAVPGRSGEISERSVEVEAVGGRGRPWKVRPSRRGGTARQPRSLQHRRG